MRDLPRNVTIDRPCDVHFASAWALERDEVVHCKEWDNVDKGRRHGVLVMDCPQPKCAPTADDINRKCRLGEYGASLMPIPAG
jgi:hypothetical protein